MRLYKQALIALILVAACGPIHASCSRFLSVTYYCQQCDLIHTYPSSKQWGGQCIRCPYQCPIVALNRLSDKNNSVAAEQDCKPVPTAAAAAAMFYGIEMADESIVELAKVAPIAATVLVTFRAQPTIDPIDMSEGVSYFSIRPNKESVLALLDGQEQKSVKLADPLASGERLRAIFRTIEDSSAQDGKITLSIEAVGDTQERTTLVALEKVKNTMLSVDMSDRQAPVYRVVDVHFVD